MSLIDKANKSLFGYKGAVPKNPNFGKSKLTFPGDKPFFEFETKDSLLHNEYSTDGRPNIKLNNKDLPKPSKLDIDKPIHEYIDNVESRLFSPYKQIISLRDIAEFKEKVLNIRNPFKK